MDWAAAKVPFLQKEIPVVSNGALNHEGFAARERDTWSGGVFDGKILVGALTAMAWISKRAPKSNGPEPTKARAGKGGRK